MNEIRTVETTKLERKRIRKHYNNLGFAMILQYLLIYIVLIFLTIIFAGFITYNETADGIPIMGAAEAFISGASGALASIIAFFIYYAISKEKIAPLFSTENVSAKFVVMSVLVSFLFYQVGMNFQYGAIIGLEIFDLEVVGYSYELANDFWARFFDLFTTVLLAPIAEELFFRGVVLKGFCKVSLRFGIIFSAIIFGLMHGNIYQAIMASFFGVVLGYITIKSGSIIPAIICHIVINFMASISDIFAYNDPVLAEEIFGTVSNIQLTLGIVAWIYLLGKRKIAVPKYSLYHKKRTLPILITSATVLITLALYIYDIISCIEPIGIEAELLIEKATKII